HGAGADLPLAEVLTLETGPLVPRDEQIRITVDHFRGGAVKDINAPLSVAKGPHAAAAADAGGGRGNCRLAGERPALVGRERQPDPAVGLALGPPLPGVPGDVDVARAVGADRAAAVESRGRLNHVPLRLESGAGVVETAVQERRRVAGRLGLRLAGPHPGDVDPAVLAHREMGPADVADGDGAVG